jgi:hypothetical protein
MTTDLSKLRFIDGGPLFLALCENNEIPFGPVCIISDYRWWSENADILEEELKIYGFSREGMVIFFPDEDSRTFWKLRWDN